MPNLAQEVRRPTEYEIKLAEKDLIAKLAEAEKCTDEECEDFFVVSARIKEQLLNGTL